MSKSKKLSKKKKIKSDLEPKLEVDRATVEVRLRIIEDRIDERFSKAVEEKARWLADSERRVEKSIATKLTEERREWESLHGIQAPVDVSERLHVLEKRVNILCENVRDKFQRIEDFWRELNYLKDYQTVLRARVDRQERRLIAMEGGPEVDHSRDREQVIPPPKEHLTDEYKMAQGAILFRRVRGELNESCDALGLTEEQKAKLTERFTPRRIVEPSPVMSEAEKMVRGGELFCRIRIAIRAKDFTNVSLLNDQFQKMGLTDGQKLEIADNCPIPPPGKCS